MFLTSIVIIYYKFLLVHSFLSSRIFSEFTIPNSDEQTQIAVETIPGDLRYR